MKKYKSFILAASAVMSLAGCNKADNLQPEEPALVNTPLTLNVSIYEQDTKTTLVDNSKVYWETGDKFYGFHQDSEGNLVQVLEFTLKSGAGSKSAEFESNAPHQMVLQGDEIVCVYGCALNEDTKLPIWPINQLATTTGTPLSGTSTRNISAVPMFAHAVASSEDTFVKAFFKNGGGLLQVNVTNNTATDIYPDMLYIDCPDGVYMCGEFKLPEFDGDGNPSIEFTTNASRTLAWKFNDTQRAVNKNTTVSFNVTVPAGTYSGLKFVYTGEFGTIPYGFIRNMKAGASITVHRSQIDQVSMNLYKEQPLTPDSPVGTIGSFTDLQDPHHDGARTGMIVGFDFRTGTPVSKLIICTANLVLSGKKELDGEEAAWNKGSLVTYKTTNPWTSGGHWRLMTVDEARTVIATDTEGTGLCQWGTLEGVEGIYWYFDPARYAKYGAQVVPNSIFLPVTHGSEGRYWLDGGYYFDFKKDVKDPTKGVVTIYDETGLIGSTHTAAVRLVHDGVNSTTL